jgi:cell division protein FtsB
MGRFDLIHLLNGTKLASFITMDNSVSLPAAVPSGMMKEVMEEKKPRSKNQFLVLLIAVLVILIFTDLNRRMADARQLEQEFEFLTTRVALLQRQNEELQEQVTALASDAMVRDWAHSEARMVLPGENLIIPLPDPELLPTADPRSPAERYVPEPWDVWRVLLFGK